MRISITATSGECIAACSRNVIGSVKASTFQPAESRSRRVAFRIDESSSSRYTARFALLSATISSSLSQGSFTLVQKSMAKRISHRCQKSVVVEWLNEKSESSGPHNGGLGGTIFMAGNKNNASVG